MRPTTDVLTTRYSLPFPKDGEQHPHHQADRVEERPRVLSSRVVRHREILPPTRNSNGRSTRWRSALGCSPGAPVPTG